MWKSLEIGWQSLVQPEFRFSRFSKAFKWGYRDWASPKLDVATRFHAFSFWLRHGPSTLRQTKQSHGFCLNLFNTAFNEGVFGIFWPCSYPATKIHSHINQKQTDYSMHASATGGSWRMNPDRVKRCTTGSVNSRALRFATLMAVLHWVHPMQLLAMALFCSLATREIVRLKRSPVDLQWLRCKNGVRQWTMQVRTNYGDYEQDKVLRSIAKLHTIGRQTACHHEILSNYAKRSDKVVMQTSLRFLDEPCMIHILRSDLKNISVNISIDKYWQKFRGH